jgi:hypothetical protein
MDVAEIVDVIVDVTAPVIVAALVNPNETVIVIDTVSDHATSGQAGRYLASI